MLFLVTPASVVQKEIRVQQACSRMESHKGLPAAHEEWLKVGCIDCFLRATWLRLSAWDLWSVFLRGAGCFELPMKQLSVRPYIYRAPRNPCRLFCGAYPWEISPNCAQIKFSSSSGGSIGIRSIRARLFVRGYCEADPCTRGRCMRHAPCVKKVQ